AEPVIHNWIVQAARSEAAAGIGTDSGDVALQSRKVSGPKFVRDLVKSLSPILRLTNLRIAFERQLLGLIESQVSRTRRGGCRLRHGGRRRLGRILRN